MICDQTIDEVEEVAEFCWDLGVAINFSVVHDRGRLSKPQQPRFLERVRWLKEQKLKGRPISTPLLSSSTTTSSALEGQPMDWTCQAGSKCFYVSAEGDFQLCYHVPSPQMLMDVTRDDLAGNRGKKGCEENCGVDCVCSTSLPFSNRADLIKLEVKRRASQLLPVLR